VGWLEFQSGNMENLKHVLSFIVIVQLAQWLGKKNKHEENCRKPKCITWKAECGLDRMVSGRLCGLCVSKRLRERVQILIIERVRSSRSCRRSIHVSVRIVLIPSTCSTGSGHCCLSPFPFKLVINLSKLCACRLADLTIQKRKSKRKTDKIFQNQAKHVFPLGHASLLMNVSLFSLFLFLFTCARAKCCDACACVRVSLVSCAWLARGFNLWRC